MLSLMETNSHHDSTTINSQKKDIEKAGSGEETGMKVQWKKEKKEKRRR